jgi:hypothetical protein
MRSSWCVGLVAIVLLSPVGRAGPARGHPARAAGKLEGHVRDSTGLPMPSAQVWIDGTEYGGVTDLRGYYLIDNIPPRVVDLTVTLVGYRRVQLKGLRISEGNTTAQDFSLEPVNLDRDAVAQRPGQVVLRDDAGAETTARATEGGRLTVGRIATGLLAQISGAVIDSARRALVGQLLGNQLNGISGEVTNLLGQPIAGARIEVDGTAFVLTGADGRFLIQPPIGRKLNLRVSAQGFSTLETPLEKLKDGQARSVILRLR